MKYVEESARLNGTLIFSKVRQWPVVPENFEVPAVNKGGVYVIRCRGELLRAREGDVLKVTFEEVGA